MNDRIFLPSTLAGITVRNRIFRSATDEGMADGNGSPTDEFYRLYERHTLLLSSSQHVISRIDFIESFTFTFTAPLFDSE